MPDSAWQDLLAYKESGVFKLAKDGVDCYVANITLTKRPNTREAKFATNADKYEGRIRSRSDKSSARTTREPPASGSITETEPTKQLFRLTIDYRNVNAATRNDTTITLPSLQSIEQSFEGCHVSTFNLSNCFYCIKVDKDS